MYTLFNIFVKFFQTDFSLFYLLWNLTPILIMFVVLYREMDKIVLYQLGKKEKKNHAFIIIIWT